MGSLFVYTSLVRTGTTRYAVTVTAPGLVTWDLLIPRPESPMEVHAFLPALTQSAVDTPYGKMDAFHGQGTGEIVYVWQWTVLRSTTLKPEGFVDLTGREGTSGFWVHRAASDAGATVHIQMAGSVEGRQLSGNFACGTWSFEGDLAEGWTLLPSSVGDCAVMTVDPLPFLAGSATLPAAGAVPIALAVLARLRSRAAA